MEIPLGGNLRRCAHHVYWPENQPFAHGCSFCNAPELLSKQEEKAAAKQFKATVFIPEILNDNSEKLFANATNSSVLCPKCKSAIHMIDAPGVWRCADCNETWKAPKRRHAEAE